MFICEHQLHYFSRLSPTRTHCHIGSHTLMLCNMYFHEHNFCIQTVHVHTHTHTHTHKTHIHTLTHNVMLVYIPHSYVYIHEHNTCSHTHARTHIHTHTSGKHCHDGSHILMQVYTFTSMLSLNDVVFLTLYGIVHA